MRSTLFVAALVVAAVVVAGCGARTNPTQSYASSRDRVIDGAIDGHDADDGPDVDDFYSDVDRDSDGDRETTGVTKGRHDLVEIDVPLGLGNGVRPPFLGPRVADVVEAAYRAAGLDAGLPGFAGRARLGGLVPAVSVRTGRDASWHDEDPDVGRGTTLEVRATWRLDRLVFDGRELQLVALEAARRRERRRLATHVIHTYYVWRRSGSRSLEAAAELDALTDGWFSESKQRTASESRTVRDPTLPRENLPVAPPGSKLP